MSMKSKFCPFFENIVKLRYFGRFSKFWTFPDLAVLEASGHAEPAAQGLQMSTKLSDFGLIRELTNSLLTIKASNRTSAWNKSSPPIFASARPSRRFSASV